MSTQRLLSSLAIAAVLGGLITIALLLKSGPSGHATGVFAGLELIPAAEVADTGSLAVHVRVPSELQFSQLSLSLDDEPIARDEEISSELILDTRNFRDGDHTLRLCAHICAEAQGCTEVVFYTQHPGVNLLGYELPEVVAAGDSLVITVRTAGEVDSLEADFSSLHSGFSPSDLVLQRLDDEHFRIIYELPDEADGGEGLHRVPILVRGVGGHRLEAPGPELRLASNSILPIRVPTGLLRETTYEGRDEGSTRAMVTWADTRLGLHPGLEQSLRVDVAGDSLDSAQLVIFMEHFSGYLLVPIAGLQLASGGQPTEPGEEGQSTSRNYLVPVHLIASSAFGQNTGAVGRVFITTLDADGRQSRVVPVAVRNEGPPPPPPVKHLVRGIGEMEIRDLDWRQTSRSMAGLLLEVRDAKGSTRGFAFCSAKGNYRIEYEVLGDPSRLPYSLVAVADSGKARTVAVTGDTTYSEVITSWDPTKVKDKITNFRIPLDAAPPFYIASMIRYGSHWAAAHGTALGKITARWSMNEPADCEGSPSCAVALLSEIRISGTWGNPDHWDSPIILHEVGHITMARMGVDDSEGGVHTLEHRSNPALAWSEGAAHYVGLRARNNIWHVDQQWWGHSTKSVLDMGGVHLGLDNGKHSEWVVASFLWSLSDGLSPQRHDRLDRWEQRTVATWRKLDASEDFSAGAPGSMDTLDFVRELVCTAPQEDYDAVYDLLSRRFEIDWLADPGLCP